MASIGVLTLELRLENSHSLKEKRHVVKSLRDRLHNKFNVSVAEIEAQDNRQMIVLGFAMVGNEAHPLKQALGEIVNALKAHPIAEFVDYELDV